VIDGKVGMVGADQITAKLVEVGNSADSLRDVWPVIGKFFAARQEAIFDKGGRPKWKPLKPDYILRRRRQGFAGRTLVRSGSLRRAATSPKPAKATDKYAVFGPSGKTASYWPLHKHGTRRMPRRDPLPPFSKSERQKVRDLIGKHIVKPWGES